MQFAGDRSYLPSAAAPAYLPSPILFFFRFILELSPNFRNTNRSLQFQSSIPAKSTFHHPFSGAAVVATPTSSPPLNGGLPLSHSRSSSITTPPLRLPLTPSLPVKTGRRLPDCCSAVRHVATTAATLLSSSRRHLRLSDSSAVVEAPSRCRCTDALPVMPPLLSSRQRRCYCCAAVAVNSLKRTACSLPQFHSTAPMSSSSSTAAAPELPSTIRRHNSTAFNMPPMCSSNASYPAASTRERASSSQRRSGSWLFIGGADGKVDGMC